jgi:hypothetical protein
VLEPLRDAETVELLLLPPLPVLLRLPVRVGQLLTLGVSLREVLAAREGEPVAVMLLEPLPLPVPLRVPLGVGEALPVGHCEEDTLGLLDCVRETLCEGEEEIVGQAEGEPDTVAVTEPQEDEDGEALLQWVVLGEPLEVGQVEKLGEVEVVELSHLEKLTETQPEDVCEPELVTLGQADVECVPVGDGEAEAQREAETQAVVVPVAVGHSVEETVAVEDTEVVVEREVVDDPVGVWEVVVLTVADALKQFEGVYVGEAEAQVVRLTVVVPLLVALGQGEDEGDTDWEREVHPEGVAEEVPQKVGEAVEVAELPGVRESWGVEEGLPVPVEEMQ